MNFASKGWLPNSSLNFDRVLRYRLGPTLILIRKEHAELERLETSLPEVWELHPKVFHDPRNPPHRG